MGVRDEFANADSIDAIPCFFVMENLAIEKFIEEEFIKKEFKILIQHRIMQADLDLLYDSDPTQQKENIDKFIERAFTMKLV